MHRGTSRNIFKEKKRCFVCLKTGHISKNYLSKMNYYNCSKQHHVAICHFDKTDSNTQDSENNTASNNDSTKEETNVNFSSPSTLFYFKLSSLLWKLQLFRATLFERNLFESGY